MCAASFDDGSTGDATNFVRLNGNGNIAPTRQISGAATLLTGPRGIAVDQASRLNADELLRLIREEG
jgi:hypothetical protein